jgi:hypothetical protein
MPNAPPGPVSSGFSCNLPRCFMSPRGHGLPRFATFLPNQPHTSPSSVVHQGLKSPSVFRVVKPQACSDRAGLSPRICESNVPPSSPKWVRHRVRRALLPRPNPSTRLLIKQSIKMASAFITPFAPKGHWSHRSGEDAIAIHPELAQKGRGNLRLLTVFWSSLKIQLLALFWNKQPIVRAEP